MKSPLRTCAAVLLGLGMLAAWTAAQDSAALLAQADRDYAASRFDAAQRGYEKALAAGAKLEADALRSRNLGRCYVSGAKPDLQRGVRWLQIAVQLNPASEEAGYLLARAQMQLGAYDDAAQNFRALAAAHPSNADYVLGVAAALRQGASVQAATDYLRGAVEHGAATGTVRLEYARLLAFQRQLPEARRQYGLLLAADPGNLAAQVGLAKVTSWQGDQEEALRQYERILQHTPSVYDALVGKAFSLLWMGRKSEAVPLLREAGRRHPEDREVREALADLGISAAPSEPTRPEPRQQAAPKPERRRPDRIAASAPASATTAATSERPAPPNSPATAPARTFSPMIKLAIAAAVAFLLLLLRTLLRVPGTKRAAQSTVQPVTTPPVAEVADVASLPETAAGPTDVPPPPPPARAEPPLPPAVPSGAKNVLAGVQVLIVGHDPAVVEVERRSLANAAATVSTCISWKDAMHSLNAVPFDVLLLNPLVDDNWTGMTAYVWLTVHRPDLQACTLLVLSTRDDASDQVCRSTNAHVLYQPFAPAELVASIHEVLERRSDSSPFPAQTPDNRPCGTGL